MKASLAALALLVPFSAALPQPKAVTPSSLPTFKAASAASRIRGGAIKTPKETFAGYSAFGAVQGTMGTAKMIVQSVLAGAFIALGSFLAFNVGAAVPGIKESNPGMQKLILGAFGLPFGLLMVVMTGGQLFTGNTALVASAWLQGTVTTAQLIKNYIVSYLGNFIGVLMIVGLIGAAGLNGGIGGGAAAVATAKCSLGFGPAFIRGFLCNWMVCMALWQQAAAGDLAGKFVGIWLPISSFVAMGFEHSIANMALIPFGMAAGADVTLNQFLVGNLLPVTLGNMVSGGLMVAGAYNYCHGQ